MSIEASRPPCFIVEWYRPELTGAQLDHTAAMLEEGATAMCGEGAPVQLLMTIAVPADEVVFGIFAASSAESVSELCRRAGLPAERLTNAVDARNIARS
jgi:hypothetical protein